MGTNVKFDYLSGRENVCVNKFSHIPRKLEQESNSSRIWSISDNLKEQINLRWTNGWGGRERNVAVDRGIKEKLNRKWSYRSERSHRSKTDVKIST